MLTYGAVKGAPKGAFISTLDSLWFAKIPSVHENQQVVSASTSSYLV